MNASKLYVNENNEYLPTNVFYCKKCNLVYRNRIDADNCCLPKLCNSCGTELPKNSFYVKCDACRRKEEAVLEKERYEKAEKIKESDYKGSVVYDKTSERYFRLEYDELNEYYEEEDVELPEYVYACKNPTVHINAENLIDQIKEDLLGRFEDPYELELNGIKELKEAIENFNSKQIIEEYIPDFKRVVILDKNKEL